MVVVNTDIYVAFDETKFFSEKECIAYEKELKGQSWGYDAIKEFTDYGYFDIDVDDFLSALVKYKAEILDYLS